MSYILDALRKAERERNLGDTPRLDFTPLPERRSGRSWVLWTLVGALGVMVGVLGAMQISHIRDRNAALQRPAAQTAANTPEAGGRDSGSGAEAARPADATGAEAAATDPGSADSQAVTRLQSRRVEVRTPSGPVEIEMPQPDAAEPAAAASPAKESRQAPAGGGAETAAASQPADEPAPDVQSTPGGDTERRELEIPSPAELAAEWGSEGIDGPAAGSGADSQGESVAEPAVAGPPPQDEPIEDQDMTSYLGLPATTRNSIGELAMNAHVYSSTPEKGFVIINGRRYRPGDELEEGPMLEEIRPGGAVMAYRGQRFLLPVPR